MKIATAVYTQTKQELVVKTGNNSFLASEEVLRANQCSNWSRINILHLCLAGCCCVRTEMALGARISERHATRTPKNNGK